MFFITKEAKEIVSDFKKMQEYCESATQFISKWLDITLWL